jgi:hypothetical protein
MPTEGPNRIYEPQHSADRKDPTQRQDRKGGCGLRFNDTHDAKNRQQNAECEKLAPGFPDLLEASDNKIRTVVIAFLLLRTVTHCLLFVGSTVEPNLSVKRPPERSWERQSALPISDPS